MSTSYLLLKENNDHATTHLSSGTYEFLLGIFLLMLCLCLGIMFKKCVHWYHTFIASLPSSMMKKDD